MTITAKYASTCPNCNRAITPGQRVEWSRGCKAVHVSCDDAPVGAAGRPAPRSSSRRRSGGSAANVPGYSSYCTGGSNCGCYDCA